MRTVHPSRIKRSAMCEPIRPAPPVTSALILCLQLRFDSTCGKELNPGFRHQELDGSNQ